MGKPKLERDFIALFHSAIYRTSKACGSRTASAIVSFYYPKIFLTSCSLVWAIETFSIYLKWNIYELSKKIIIPSLYIQIFLELLNKCGKTQVRKRFYSPFSLSHILQCPTKLPASTAPELQVRLYCFYIPKVYTPHEISFLRLNLHTQSLRLDKLRVYRKRDEVRDVLVFYILLCWILYCSILTIFVWNFLRFLIRFTLATPLVTPPCTTI